MPLHDPLALQEYIESQVSTIGAADFIAKREHNRLREMWCAARFGIGYKNNFSSCQISVEERDEYREYDFHLQIKDQLLPFQVAEVLDKGRRRDQEYRDLTEEERNALERARAKGSASYAGEQIRQALMRKIQKHYSKPEELHVLLYLNISAAAVPWAAIANAAEFESKTFASVWVVTQDIFCCIYGGRKWHGLVGWKRIDVESSHETPSK